jgi:hypothetical protein
LFALAGKRELRVAGTRIERTPLLVPSFSSRVPEIEKVFRACEEFIDGPILVSAYDIGKGLLLPPFDFGSIVFLDSGGYEVSTETDFSDVSGQAPLSTDWPEKAHTEVLKAWNPKVPSVVINYDHPKARHPMKAQIANAKEFAVPAGMAREFLIKPETCDQRFVHIGSVIAHARDLATFDVIGVTEREIGNSVFDRMKNLARLRLALRKVGSDPPIHVFGSLDTVTTLFYFVAGADIFDGLTWLRYGFKDGNTLYKQNFGILDLGFSMKTPIVEAMCWSKNYQYMKDMELEMRRFLNGYDFGSFQYHGRLLAAAYKSVEEELEG